MLKIYFYLCCNFTCFRSKFLFYVVTFMCTKKHLVKVQKTSCFGLKIPVLVATNEAGDVLTSHKYIRFFSSQTIINTISNISLVTPPADMKVRSCDVNVT